MPSVMNVGATEIAATINNEVEDSKTKIKLREIWAVHSRDSSAPRPQDKEATNSGDHRAAVSKADLMPRKTISRHASSKINPAPHNNHRATGQGRSGHHNKEVNKTGQMAISKTAHNNHVHQDHHVMVKVAGIRHLQAVKFFLIKIQKTDAL